MKRMKFAASLVLLAACSGASSVTTTDQDAGSELDASVEDGNVSASHDASSAPHDGSTWSSDGGADASEVDGSSAVVDGSTVDAGPDASFDAGPDASFDAGPDASFDAGPPDICPTLHCNYPSAPRCDGVIGEDCMPANGNAFACWTSNGDQACCTQASRWKMTMPNRDTDQTTGRTWAQGYATGPANGLGGVCDPDRMPTVAELKALLIGVGTCGPPIDHVVFKTSAGLPNELLASDGCVDMTNGQAEAVCVGAKVMLLCTAKP